jgi:hypothetical protein
MAKSCGGKMGMGGMKGGKKSSGKTGLPVATSTKAKKKKKK